ncbi:hypothetical protein O3P69_003976 [Scylla paramamosain]|uniref:Uncharacterized protein n=1 Tax=Scylla paramamosain TaxID=85552 RepID=A0AAW0UFU1_SCYPA
MRDMKVVPARDRRNKRLGERFPESTPRTGCCSHRDSSPQAFRGRVGSPLSGGICISGDSAGTGGGGGWENHQYYSLDAHASSGGGSCCRVRPSSLFLPRPLGVTYPDSTHRTPPRCPSVVCVFRWCTPKNQMIPIQIDCPMCIRLVDLQCCE